MQRFIIKNYGIYSLFLVIIVGITIILHFSFSGQEVEKDNGSVQIYFNELQTQEAKNVQELGDVKLIYVSRTISGFDKQKNNKYRTDFYLTDLKGEKKYKFYMAEDLTYEVAYPFGNEKIMILKEFGTQENRLIDFQGKVVKDLFIPPVGFGTDFLLSKDSKNSF